MSLLENNEATARHDIRDLDICSFSHGPKGKLNAKHMPIHYTEPLWNTEVWEILLVATSAPTRFQEIGMILPKLEGSGTLDLSEFVLVCGKDTAQRQDEQERGAGLFGYMCGFNPPTRMWSRLMMASQQYRISKRDVILGCVAFRDDGLCVKDGNLEHKTGEQCFNIRSSKRD